MHEVIKMTSAEIANLWNTYTNDSMIACLMTHFAETVTDPEVAVLINETRNTVSTNMKRVEELLETEGIAVPVAYPVDKHVNSGAPKLFSDVFYLEHIRHMCKFGLASHASAVSLSAREDVRSLFHDFLQNALSLNNQVMVTMQKKGVYIRTPLMNYPHEIDYIDKQNFMTGWFGRRRPLLAIEVAHLTTNAIHNEMGRALCMGFSQVAQDEEIRNYFIRGKKVSSKIVDTIHDTLKESDIPTTMTWDYSVTDSTTPPFSDQLMMYVVGGLSNLGVGTYGLGISISMRRDLGLMYSEFIRTATSFGEDGLQMMIERKWMEQPPHFSDRHRLATDK